MTSPANFRVNSARLWDSLEDMAKTGPGLRGGCNRQALTDEDRAGRLLFQNGVRQPVSKSRSTRLAICSHDAKGPTLLCHPFCSVRISTPSRPAANMTVCSEYLAGLKWCAR